MSPCSGSGENLSAVGIESKDAHGVQFSNALALHAAMIKVRSELPNEPYIGFLDLSSFVPHLSGAAAPWPQIGDLRSFAQPFLESEAGDSYSVQVVYAELSNLTNDLAIWIVERYFRPEFPAVVSQLNPDFQQAGLGYLLYKCYENKRQWLAEEVKELTAAGRSLESTLDVAEREFGRHVSRPSTSGKAERRAARSSTTSARAHHRRRSMPERS